MAKTSKSESPAADTPRIEAVIPDAALPGGEIEVRGANLGPVGTQRPTAVIGSTLAPVLLSQSSKVVVRVPENASPAWLEISRKRVPQQPRSTEARAPAG